MNVKEAASLPMRQVVAGYLKEQMAQDDKVIVINADLGGACGTAGLAKDFPDRTLNVGIAEANMVGVAAGLASYGYKPFIFTFAPFATRRVADQLAISVSYAGLKVVVVGTDPGVSAQMNGGTHMGVEDTAIMRAIPGMSPPTAASIWRRCLRSWRTTVPSISASSASSPRRSIRG